MDEAIKGMNGGENFLNSGYGVKEGLATLASGFHRGFVCAQAMNVSRGAGPQS